MLIEEKGEKTGVPESRKHVTWYTRGLPGSADLRHEVNQTRGQDELFAVLDSYLGLLEPRALPLTGQEAISTRGPSRGRVGRGRSRALPQAATKT